MHKSQFSYQTTLRKACHCKLAIFLENELVSLSAMQQSSSKSHIRLPSSTNMPMPLSILRNEWGGGGLPFLGFNYLRTQTNPASTLTLPVLKNDLQLRKWMWHDESTKFKT